MLAVEYQEIPPLIPQHFHQACVGVAQETADNCFASEELRLCPIRLHVSPRCLMPPLRGHLCAHGERGSRCRGNILHCLRSTGERWLSWHGQGVARSSWRPSSSYREDGSAAGSSRRS